MPEKEEKNMEFETKEFDTWEVKECENKACSNTFENNLRNTLYERDGTLHIVCTKCNKVFYTKMKELYPTELPNDF